MLLALAVLLSFIATASAQTTQPAPTIEKRSLVTLGQVTKDQIGQSFKVAGVSGIVWLKDDHYLAVMDNSNHVISLKIKLHDDGRIESAAITGGLSLEQRLDFEGITISPHEKDAVFLSHEGSNEPPPAKSTDGPPDIREYSLTTGKLLRHVKVPAVFAQRRPNFGLESLTMTADGGEMWTANEEALAVDGEVSSQDHGTTVRLVRIIPAGETYTVSAQYAYQTDPIPTALLPGKGADSRSGVSDLVALPDGRLLVLERAFLSNHLLSSLDARIYLVDFVDATDVNGFVNGLKGKDYKPATKTLLWSGTVGNLEGLALGPKLKDGRRALLGVTDGNNVLGNSVVSFEIDLDPDPK